MGKSTMVITMSLLDYERYEKIKNQFNDLISDINKCFDFSLHEKNNNESVFFDLNLFKNYICKYIDIEGIHIEVKQ